MSTVPSSPSAATRSAFQPEADSEPKPQEKKQEKQSTSYVVLAADARVDGTWKVLGAAEASSAKVAIQAVVDKMEQKAGSYVAVPERSWHPLIVKVETQTVVKFAG